LSGVDQVVFLFTPLVAAKQWVDQVVAFDVEPDFSLFEKGAVQLLQGLSANPAKLMDKCF